MEGESFGKSINRFMENIRTKVIFKTLLLAVKQRTNKKSRPFRTSITPMHVLHNTITFFTAFRKAVILTDLSNYIKLTGHHRWISNNGRNGGRRWLHWRFTLIIMTTTTSILVVVALATPLLPMRHITTPRRHVRRLVERH